MKTSFNFSLYDPRKIYYSLTVKKVEGNPELVLPIHYANWLCNALNKIKSIEILESVFERDEHKRLHLHAILTGPKNLYKKKLLVVGYHQFIEVLPTEFNVRAWVNYIRKEQEMIEQDQKDIQEIDTEDPYLVL